MQIIKRLMTRYMPGMLTCEEVDQFIYDYHKNRLSTFEALKFNIHLSMCSECKAYVMAYKNTIRLTKAGISAPEPIEKVPEELIQVILNSRKERNNSPHDS